MSLVIIKYVSSAKKREDEDEIIIWMKDKTLKIAISGFILIIIISPFAASFLHISKILYMILIAISFIFSLMTVANRSILQGLLRFKDMVISLLVEGLTKLALCGVLVYFGFAVGGAMIGWVISIIAGWYLTNLYIDKKKVKINKFDAKPILLFAMPVLLQSISATSLYSSDLILVKHFFSSHDAGIYAALSTLGMIIFFATGPIGAVMFPFISQKSAAGSDYKKIFIFSFCATAFSAFCLLGIYWINPQFIVKLLYGSLYIEAANLLVWFSVFITLFTLSNLIITLNLSLGKTNVVIFPVVAASLQILGIYFYHNNLFQVIMVSILATALLLSFLLIYSSYGNKAAFSNRPGL